MLPISNIVKIEKNKLNSDSVWLVLLEITIPSVTEVIRIVNNNEDITWNGQTWQRFPFDIDTISENSNGEISQFTIKVSNVNNIIGNYVRQYEVYLKTNPNAPILANLIVINTKDLANTTPVYQARLTLETSSLNFFEAVFTIGSYNTYNKLMPTKRMFSKDFPLIGNLGVNI